MFLNWVSRIVRFFKDHACAFNLASQKKLRLLIIVRSKKVNNKLFLEKITSFKRNLLSNQVNKLYNVYQIIDLCISDYRSLYTRLYIFAFLFGWAMLDLNQRPHPYQGCALTNWANSPTCFYYKQPFFCCQVILPISFVINLCLIKLLFNLVAVK